MLPCVPLETRDNAGAPMRPVPSDDPSRSRRLARLVASGLPVVAWLALAPAAGAHGGIVPPEPTFLDFAVGWSFDPLVAIPLLLTAAAYLWMMAQVNAAHPRTRVPAARPAAFLAGLAVLAIALQSGIEQYDTTLFSVHMVQHVLLTLIAAPLLVLGAPVTLVLRFSRPQFRRRWVLPILHSRILRVLSFPVVAWLLFAATMWGTHFSPLFDAALENPLIHDVEHLLYLGVGLLFWWPVVGLDPGPWRMSYPARILYLFLQMPQNTFLGLVIYMAGEPLYRHYVTTVRTWGPTPLADQQVAGGLMWVIGDVIFFIAILGVVAAWMRSEERPNPSRDARVASETAAIRARETALAQRRATERQPEADVPKIG